MKNFKRKDLLFSLCGLNMHLGGYCPGCGGGEGNQGCAAARCGVEHGVEYCWQCSGFPCARYEIEDEYDSFITYKRRLADMDRARQIGPAAYEEEQREKYEILRFLLDNYNDGRKKSFYALAVNLLELETLRKIAGELAAEWNDRPVCERAAWAAALCRAADRQGIVLKLRKKPDRR